MIIPVDYSQVNMRFSGNGYLRGAEVVFGVDNSGSSDPPFDIATEVASLWETWVKSVQAVSIQLDEVYVKNGPNATGPDATLAVGTVGDQAANSLPPSDCVLVRKITATGGRKNRGRMFWPGATEAQTQGGGLLFGVGGLDVWSTAIAGFWVGLGTAGYPMVILHTDATTPTPVTNVQVQQLMAIQRRRMRRVGG